MRYFFIVALLLSVFAVETKAETPKAPNASGINAPLRNRLFGSHARRTPVRSLFKRVTGR